MTASEPGLVQSMTARELASRIQHTLIDATVTSDDIVRHCAEAAEYRFNAAMVAGPWVPLAVSELQGTGILVASALDFPSVGVMTTAGKAAEAAELVRLGAQQLDMGVQIGWLRSGSFDSFRDDIAAVVKAAGVPVKVMLELPLLSETEREAAVELSMEAGAAYLKNASSGQIETANAASVRYLAERVRDGVKVKASGAIKSRDQVLELLGAGADLVGTSAGIAIVTSADDETTTSY